jgi:hypothetical protein
MGMMLIAHGLNDGFVVRGVPVEEENYVGAATVDFAVTR